MGFFDRFKKNTNEVKQESFDNASYVEQKLSEIDHSPSSEHIMSYAHEEALKVQEELEKRKMEEERQRLEEQQRREEANKRALEEDRKRRERAMKKIIDSLGTENEEKVLASLNDRHRESILRRKKHYLKQRYVSNHEYALILDELLYFIFEQDRLNSMSNREKVLAASSKVIPYHGGTFYGSSEKSVLAQYNYARLNKMDSSDNLNVMFIPYLEQLESVGAGYLENNPGMPKSVFDMYNMYREHPDDIVKKDMYFLGLMLLNVMGIIGLDDLKEFDFYNKQSVDYRDEFLKKCMDFNMQISSELPDQYKQYVNGGVEAMSSSVKL